MRDVYQFPWPFGVQHAYPVTWCLDASLCPGQATGQAYLPGSFEELERVSAANLGSVPNQEAPTFNWPTLQCVLEQQLCAAGVTSNQHLLRFINTLSVLGTLSVYSLVSAMISENLETLDTEPSCMPH